MKMNSIVKILIEAIGIAISLVLFVSGLHFLIKSRQKKRYSSKTLGVITDNDIIRESTMPDNGSFTTKRYYYALCEYVVDGVRCVKETAIGTTQPKYKIGQAVTVYYNPNNCHEAYIEGDDNSRIKAVVCLILGIVVLIFVFLCVLAN